MRYYLLFIILMILPLVSPAQEDTLHRHQSPTNAIHTFGISTAVLTPDYLMDGYRPGRPTEFDYANKGSKAALCVTYKYRLSEGAYIGLSGMIEQQHGDWLDNYIPDGNVFDLQTTVKGQFIRTCYTLGTDLTWEYAYNGLTAFYTSIGIGFTYEVEAAEYDPTFYNKGYENGVNQYGPMRQDKKKMHFNADWSPFGIRIGRQLCYFVELGFGYRGVVNTGLCYHIKHAATK